MKRIATIGVVFAVMLVAAISLAVYAAKNSCTDSDGGNVPAVFGWVYGIASNVQYNYTDSCVNSTHLTERVCSGTSPSFSTVSCLTNATNTCQSGRCVYVTPNSCSDSDGGNVPATFGWTSGFAGGSPYNYTDSCVNSTHITERICSGTSPSSMVVSCLTNSTNTCQSGQCVYVQPDTCADTDGGFVSLVQGTASGFLNQASYSLTDFCLDTSMLQEYYCSGGHAYNFALNCTGNMTSTCSNGACV